jgi:hypothetical protein
VQIRRDLQLEKVTETDPGCGSADRALHSGFAFAL